MVDYDDYLFSPSFDPSLDSTVSMIVDREQSQSNSRKPITSPSFFRGRSAPKPKTLLYHFFMVLGIICIALVFGGMFGVLLRGLAPLVP